MRPAVAEINLKNLQYNLLRVKGLRPRAKILAVIKANGYGHGLLQVANALQSADAFAVASCEEAQRLFDNGITKPLVLLSGFFNQEEIATICQHKWIPVIHSADQAQQLLRHLQKNPLDTCQLFLKLDSGMHRLGLLPEDFFETYQQLKMAPQILGVTLMTHFASADTRNSQDIAPQWQCFYEMTKDMPDQRSVANSAIILGHPLIEDQWVRPGIMLYGASPFVDAHAVDDGLKPVMTLSSKIISLRHVSKGERVGYGGTWQAMRNSRIATIALGYADGYPRHAPSGTPVVIHGKRFPLAGRVSMDLITVDVTDCEAVKVGDTVEFWGGQMPVDEIARAANTIAYELLVGVNTRVAFSYV